MILTILKRWQVTWVFYWLSLIGVAMAQPEGEQIWYGTLDVGVAELRLSLHLNQDASGGWTGTVISHDQNQARIPVSSITLDESSLSISMTSVGATFTGQMDSTNQTVTGKWIQGTSKTDLTFRRVAAIPSRKLIEVWKGTLDAGNRKFPFQVRVFEEIGRANHPAQLDSFSEGALGLTVKLLKSTEEVEFKVPISAATFQGKRDDQQKKIVGHWIQRGNRLPLEFDVLPPEKVQLEMGVRPQTPRPPYPFDTQELSIPVAEGVTISGTLALPKGTGPFPVVVTITGSGPQDRDETILDHRPFLVITEALTSRGIAVFRYDERGVGKSSGRYAEATTRDFAEDGNHILTFLSKMPEINPLKMGIIGHSEGGIVAPMIASNREDLAAVVLLAGPSVPGKQIIFNQTEAIARVAGADEKSIEAQRKLLTRVLGSQTLTPGNLDNKGAGKDSPGRQNSITMMWEQFSEAFGNSLAEKSVKESFGTPWMKFFLDYDPAEALRKLKVPTLALFGEKDLQVSATLNIPPLQRALEEAGNRDFEIVTIPGVNHLFQTCDKGLPTEYGTITETIAPIVIEKLGAWLTQRLVTQ